MNHTPDGKAETFFQEVTRFVRFGDDDRRALAAFHSYAAPHFTAVTNRFYDRLAEHPQAAQLIASHGRLSRFKTTLAGWLDSLLTGPWDETYFADRARIGRTHVKVQLPQRYLVTAMNLVRDQLECICADAYADQPDQAARTRTAIAKILDVELTIMLEGFSEEHVEGVQRVERKVQDVLRQRLDISEARYSSIVENAAALVVATDVDYRVLTFNETAEEVTGYGREEMVGQNCLDRLCHPSFHATARAALDTALAGGKPAPFDAELTAQNGSRRRIRWHVTNLPDDLTPLACAIGIDITEARQLEERTRRAERLAALGTMAAGLAHEIRNPLNAAQLQLKLVERRLTRSESLAAGSHAGALGAASVVRSELERLAGLVQDFLAFARPHALRLAPADLRESVATVTTLLLPEAEAAGVALTAERGADAVPARCDDERVKQVLHNLVRNGIEAAGAGGEVRVAVRAKGNLAELTVTDTGPGVLHPGKIFEPFATYKPGGTGLGLAIVHRIVMDHGGDIRVGRDGNRTVFIVEIPRGDPPAP